MAPKLIQKLTFYLFSVSKCRKQNQKKKKEKKIQKQTIKQKYNTFNKTSHMNFLENLQFLLS